MKKKSSLSGLMAAAIAALGIAVLPACGDDAADKAAADKAASKPPVQQTTAAKEDKDTLAAARNQFADVKLAAGPLKQQVELCFFDTGSLTSCSDDQKGIGWDLKRAAADTAGDYLASTSVKKGVISLTSRDIKFNGTDTFSLILVPALTKENGSDVVSWKVDPASTCLAAGLCEDKKTGM